MKKKPFQTNITPRTQLDAIQRNWLTYEFQILEEDQIIPLQPLHKKPDFAFSISYKILATANISLITIGAITDTIDALYPKCEGEWETEIVEGVKEGFVVVCLIETL